VLPVRNVQRADVGVAMTLRVMEAAKGKSRNANDNQKNSDKSGCFQGDLSWCQDLCDRSILGCEMRRHGKASKPGCDPASL
jgi:hypothetical protein